jgi:hypothetical protein
MAPPTASGFAFKHSVWSGRAARALKKGGVSVLSSKRIYIAAAASAGLAIRSGANPARAAPAIAALTSQMTITPAAPRTSIHSLIRRVSAFVMTFVLLGWSAAAHADPVYLTCTDTNSFSRYLTVDYGANVVTTSDFNVTSPYLDGAGNAAQPAQVTESQIAWKIVTKRANGLFYAEHFTLNRLNGGLAYYDDGTQHGESWVCQVGAKPMPKF